jgi:hypothetical protein
MEGFARNTWKCAGALSQACLLYPHIVCLIQGRYTGVPELRNKQKSKKFLFENLLGIQCSEE